MSMEDFVHEIIHVCNREVGMDVRVLFLATKFSSSFTYVHVLWRCDVGMIAE